MGLLAIAYTNQKAVSLYILLRVKPTLSNTKIRSHRFLDVTRSIDNGFSLYVTPAFYRSPGILNICRYIHFAQVTGSCRVVEYCRNSFRVCVKSKEQRVES